jgi:hypothetical protein
MRFVKFALLIGERKVQVSPAARVHFVRANGRRIEHRCGRRHFFFLCQIVTALCSTMHRIERGGITRERARACADAIDYANLLSDAFPLGGETLSAGCRSSLTRNQRAGAHPQVAAARLLLFRSLAHPASRSLSAFCSSRCTS